MYKHELIELSKLGSFDSTYGQKYWGRVLEEEKPISFNSMQQDIEVGDIITCEEQALRRSKKNTEYLQLKKVKKVDSVVEHSPENAEKATSSPTLIARNDIVERLDTIIDLLHRLVGDDADEEPSELGDEMSEDFLREQ